MNDLMSSLPRIRTHRARRASSWDPTGGNSDWYDIAPGETRVLADLKGPGCIRHIWMTQQAFFRETLLRITWDNAPHPSILCPLGDFFGLGHNIVNSYQSLLFSASATHDNRMTDASKARTFEHGCALNCYVPMPFRERALIEVINETAIDGPGRFFIIDYEDLPEPPPDGTGYFHAEWRRVNPFPGWAPYGVAGMNTAANKERTAWNNNYVILDTKGRGHYLGCNLSVTNFIGGWWGEGDEMIWVDGYDWPPALHGTGSEDYFGHAWGMQDNAFLRNGSSIHEHNTGGYQTSYVHHLENPVPFSKEIRVTIEHGHANNLVNEMSSTAYWYADTPCRACDVPPVGKRMPVLRAGDGQWLHDHSTRTGRTEIALTEEMAALRSSVPPG
jgi:hypothetical protein